jgi:two-component system response regulator DctR
MSADLPFDQTVYLCGDDDGVRDAVAFMLQQHGLRVSAHASGPALLATVDATARPLRGIST